MDLLRTIALLGFALAAGCTGVREAPPSAMAPSGRLVIDSALPAGSQDSIAAAQPVRSEAIQETIAVKPPSVAPRLPATGPDATGGREALADASVVPSKKLSADAAAPSPAKAPAKLANSALTVEPPGNHDKAPPVAKKLEPPLDVAALKARLRDTTAIGMFTKLALKNQVDDLLQQFRAHYLSGQETNVAALRQPYDMLVLKVLALIQDGDPSLARTILGSREAIWNILADKKKFNSVS